MSLIWQKRNQRKILTAQNLEMNWSKLNAKCQNFATVSLVQLVVVTTLAMMDY